MHPSPSSLSVSSRIFSIVGRIAPGLPLIKHGSAAPQEVEVTFAPRLRPTLFNHKAMERQVHVPQIEGAASVFSMPLSRLRYNYLDGVFHCLLSRGFVGASDRARKNSAAARVLAQKVSFGRGREGEADFLYRRYRRGVEGDLPSQGGRVPKRESRSVLT